MLKALNSDQANFVALLAKAVRLQRDELLGNVAEGNLTESKGARGEHNPTATLGFEPVSQEAPQLAALREAITGLSSAGRSELYALMRIGQGELAAGQWHRGMVDTMTLGDETITALLMEDPDLHDHLVKGLYEVGLAS